MTEQQKQPRYFYVGQTVYHYQFGSGKIDSINNAGQYPIVVEFEKTGKHTFTADGRLGVSDPIVSLSQTPIPEIQNEPLPEMPDLKEGDVVVVRDYRDTDWIIKFFAGYSQGSEYLYCATSHPCLSRGFNNWKFCEKYDPGKHRPQ